MPGDEICNNKNVEAITGSVMAGLATLDGIVCELDTDFSAPRLTGTAFLSTSYVQSLADRFGRRPLLIGLPLLATISTAAMMIACMSSILPVECKR